MTLEEMRNIDINSVDINTVPESSDIKIDIDLPILDRVKSYQQQNSNLYFLKVKGVLVKMDYAETDKSLNDCMERFLKTC